LSVEDARTLLDSIPLDSLQGLRDRALIGVMLFSFARVSAVLGMKVSDFYENGRRRWFRLLEKSGKHHEVPVHRVTTPPKWRSWMVKAGVIFSGVKSGPLLNAFFVREAGTPVECLYLVTFKHGETLAWILHVPVMTASVPPPSRVQFLF
jgi:integrase